MSNLETILNRSFRMGRAADARDDWQDEAEEKFLASATYRDAAAQGEAAAALDAWYEGYNGLARGAYAAEAAAEAARTARTARTARDAAETAEGDAIREWAAAGYPLAGEPAVRAAETTTIAARVAAATAHRRAVTAARNA